MRESSTLPASLALLFTVRFTAMVSINRFVQLTVIRRAIGRGQTEGLARFLPYSSTSVTFALEILGWGFFLGIAALVMAPVLERGKLESGIRWSLVGYGALSLIGSLGYAADSNLFLVGFLAWGLMLYVVTGLLTVWFRAAARQLG